MRAEIKYLVAVRDFWSSGTFILKGSKYTLRDENLHSYDDLPALIYPDGTQEWCRDGQCHREDGPARINSSGSQWWYRDGQCHREDGPAIIDFDGTQWWWLNNKEVDPLEVLKLMKAKGIDLTEYGFSPDEAVREAFKKLEEGL